MLQVRALKLSAIAASAVALRQKAHSWVTSSISPVPIQAALAYIAPPLAYSLLTSHAAAARATASNSLERISWRWYAATLSAPIRPTAPIAPLLLSMLIRPFTSPATKVLISCFTQRQQE